MFRSPEAKQEIREGAAYIRGAINTLRVALKLEVEHEIEIFPGVVERKVETAINEAIDRKADWLLGALDEWLKH